MSDLSWLLHQAEGQFFERKSCYDRATGTPRRRDVRALAGDAAETLAAMANADGGTLVLGIENDGTVTGIDHPADRLQVVVDAPGTHVRPPLQAQVRIGELEGRQLVVFEVDWSADVHQLVDGRYILRVGDRNMPFPAGDIEAIKAGRRRRVTEERSVPDAALADLDLDLVAQLATRMGFDEPAEAVLLRYRLAERRVGRLVPTLAALLLFGREPTRWHPRCEIDFVRYSGTERRVGTALNIIKRERIEAPLVRLIDEAYRFIQSQVRERQQLVDLFFEERFEYPTFAWQEAIVNAVAHRDYRYEGLAIEIWMFDDRMEIRSPGALVEPVTLDRLRRRARIHTSRNPRIVRVLTDAGYMRELGEGVPRMFEVMEREGLYPPEFQLDADVIFTVTLRNEPIYSRETLRWLSQFEPLGLSGNQKRLLAYAREHDGTFTSRAYQRLAHVDLYAAQRDIRDLIRRGAVRLSRRGGRVYQLASPASAASPEKPSEYQALEPVLLEQGYVKNADIQTRLGVRRRQAARIAKQLVDLGWLREEGYGRGRRYMAVRDGAEGHR
ncbi:MAG: putative DNA binding domain-containing protein [Chloroflexi bacterium]|nr:putative DNA binding domain-containing protein [Chloroflexota bacterium]